MARDRNAFLAFEQAGEEEKMLVSRIDDMVKLCEKTYTARFSAFLTEAEAALAERYLAYCGFGGYMLYGGYEGAQRVILGVFPQFDEPCSDNFPVAAVKFYGRAAAGLSHRDYLGSLMSLGITRNSVGDIVCCGEKAYAMLSPSAADMAVMQISKIGRAGIKCEMCGSDEEIVRNDSFSEISGTVASLRLDSVLGTALRMSREKAAQLIRSGSVSVNHGITESVSEILSEGDILSVRGHGRFILDKTGNRTKKDRIHITVKKHL